MPSSESTAIAAAARGGGGGVGGGGGDDSVREQLPCGIPPLPVAHKNRRSTFSADLSNLAVVGGGATGNTHARRVSPGMSASSLNTTVVSLGKDQRQRNRLMGRSSSNRVGAGRVNDDYGGGTTASASPELLHASGRITAGRYHEMLAEIDGREGSGSAASGNEVRTTFPAARKAVEPP